MKKMLYGAAVCIAALVMTTGCSSSLMEMPAHVEKGNETIPQSAIYVGHRNSETVMDAIKAAAKTEGWRVTEFKADAVIVEKILGDKTISSTIKYHSEHIYGDSEHAPMSDLLNLRHAIVEELEKGPKAH